MVTGRQAQLLKLVVEQYIETAEPVGSKFLVEMEHLDVSGATVRNEMRELEDQGFLTHPHTSAGRMPTETGYRYYVEHLLRPETPRATVRDDLHAMTKDTADRVDRAKTLSRYIADYIENAVILSLARRSMYYTGMVNLFSQPEFHDAAHTVDMSSVFDECEERFENLYEMVSPGEPTHVFVGEENPLGRNCGTVTSRLGRHDLIAIIGPIRMPYERAVGILEYIKRMI